MINLRWWDSSFNMFNVQRWSVFVKAIEKMDFSRFEIIINVLVSSFWFIWIPMSWIYDHYKYCISSVQWPFLYALKGMSSDVVSYPRYIFVSTLLFHWFLWFTFQPHPTAAPTPPANKAQSRMSFRHVGSVVMRLLANMKSTASMPFSQVIEPGHEDKSNKVVSVNIIYISL